MRIFIAALMTLALAASFSFADEGEQSDTKEASIKVVREAMIRTAAPDLVTGKVDRVILADLLTIPRSKIVIVDTAGDSEEFTIKALAVVYDSTGRFLTLNDVKPGQEVQINYITKPGKVKEAASIKMIK